MFTKCCQVEFKLRVTLGNKLKIKSRLILFDFYDSWTEAIVIATGGLF